jgi:Ser/Thr protein kinase RdoA (MazF antagonist)
VRSEPVVDAAVGGALALAAAHGLGGVEPIVLADGANVVVHLWPAPVVVKAAATTLAVRPDAADWLGREIEVAAHVAAAGLPVIRPSDLLPQGIHVVDGIPMTCWEYVDVAPSVPAADELAAMLLDLHAVLGSYPGKLPVLGTPLLDIGRFLDRGSLPAPQNAALRKAFERLQPLPSPPAQALHGDPHPGNLLRTAGGWIWCDFEDTCAGPVQWDLAAVATSTRIDGAAVVAAYGDVGDLRPWLELRRMHAAVWYSLYAERIPGLAEQARVRLAEWPA